MSRALVGVYRNLIPDHLHARRAYAAPPEPRSRLALDEIVRRWNHREPVKEVVRQWRTTSSVHRERLTVIWEPVPAVLQMRSLLQGVVGKQLRRSKNFGITRPS